MDVQAMFNRIDEISCLLYQNKEEQAFVEVQELLLALKEMLQQVTITDDGIKEFCNVMFGELLDAYKYKDVLALADCLQEKVTLFVEYYYSN